MVFELTDILLESLRPASPAHTHTEKEKTESSKTRSMKRSGKILSSISYDPQFTIYHFTILPLFERGEIYHELST